MSEYATVANICRDRPRSKHARIVGGLIVGTAEPAATEETPSRRKPKLLAELTCISSDNAWEDFVRLKIKLDRKTFASFRDLAAAENRSVESLLRRSLLNSAKSWNRIAEKMKGVEE